MPERDIARLGPEVLAGILPRIYPQMLEEVHRHQDEGRATFIVSAAGNEMVAQLAGVLGMEGGIGTSYEVGPDGGYTGALDGPFVYGEGKVEAMGRFAAEHGIDMGESYAYSDSVSDLPMLRSVGNAVVVNPDPSCWSSRARRAGGCCASSASAAAWRSRRGTALGRGRRHAARLGAARSRAGGARVAAGDFGPDRDASSMRSAARAAA